MPVYQSPYSADDQLNRVHDELTQAILSEAQRILKHRNAWTQRAFARDGKGRVCRTDDKSATCFSIIGATLRARINLGIKNIPRIGEIAGDPVTQCLKQAMVRFGRDHIQSMPTSVETFNDGKRRKHEEILLVLKYAISIAKGSSE